MASVGISIGISLASAALTSILTPKPEPTRSLDDLSVLKSELGVPIPKVYGRAKVTGNIIWAPDIIERKESASGGKGGGGRDEFKYYGTFAVLLCEGEVENIGRIWLNNKLVSDKLSGNAPTVSQSNNFEDKYVTRYLGTDSQTADATIEAYEGSGNVPGFRNRVYLVFDELPLDEYGNAIPKVEVEIINTTTSPSLQTVLEDVCVRAGLASGEYDASALSGTNVTGAILKQDGQSVREFIEELQRCYHFISKEVAGVVKFEPIEQQTAIDIPATALGTKEDTEEEGDLYTETREQLIDLPSQVQLEYLNGENKYNRGIQVAYKAIASHVNEMSFNVGVVLTNDEAATAATKNLEYYWSQRRRYEGIKLPIEYLTLEPGDLLNLPIRNSIVQVQVQKVNIGANLIVEVDGVSYSTRINNLSVTTPEITYKEEFLPYSGTEPEARILDVNLIRDSDAEFGLYASVTPDPAGSGWNGGTLYSKPEGGDYIATASIPQVSAQGTLNAEAPVGNPYVVDRFGKITVTLEYGQLESVPDFDFYDLRNVIWIGGELIGFQTATLVSANTYELTNLIRGARGTEGSIAAHASSSEFFLVKGNFGFEDIAGTVSQLEQTYNFKAVPSGIAQTEITPETEVTIAGNRLKPYAPSNPAITKKTNNDLLLTWNRRTRKQGEWLKSSETVPLNEDSELYELEIYDGSTLVRTESLTSPTYTYTSANQVSDFGSNQNQLTFKLYQISALVGRGYPLEVTNLRFKKVEA
ncbi:phage tail protein [Myxosarcina sp. GI1(2024)]